MQNDLLPDLARMRIQPAGPVAAGAFGSWRVLIEVGRRGIDDGGTLRLTLRGATDWQEPQFSDPAAPGFSSLTYGGPAELTPHFSHKGHVRPYFWCLSIDVRGAALAPGEIVTITLGDTSRGSPGLRAQTYAEARREFALEADPTNSNLPRRADACELRVVPGQPAALKVLLPSRVALGAAIRPVLIAEDIWGNPLAQPPKAGKMTWHGSAAVRLEKAQLIFEQPGSGRLEIDALCCGVSLSGVSNPVEAAVRAERLLWGDLHAQTSATVGSGDEDQFFTFARDTACLDFAGHQANDFQVSDRYWRHLNAKSREYSRDQRFVVLPGYEWSGNTPVGGDHNLWYLEEDLPIFRSCAWLVEGAIKDRCAESITELCRSLKAAGLTEKVILGLHAGGRHAQPALGPDPDISYLAEVASGWGVFEWLLFAALEAGYRLGVTANSDGHMGRPGAEHPGAGEFSRRGGLTCLPDAELTRRGVFQALRARRCYATTGARIILDARLAGRRMGEIVPLREPAALEFSVIGSAPLEKVELFDGPRCVAALRPLLAAGAPPDGATLRVSWGGACCRGRERRKHWRGDIRAGNGLRFLSARAVGIHSPADRILLLNEERITLDTRTAGETHAVDIQVASLCGALEFVSGEVHETFKPRPGGALQNRPAGGLGLFTSLESYPWNSAAAEMKGAFPVAAPQRPRPYLLKVTQSDGELAWSSPFYVEPV